MADWPKWTAEHEQDVLDVLNGDKTLTISGSEVRIDG